jgi:hypothetical protein
MRPSVTLSRDQQRHAACLATHLTAPRYGQILAAWQSSAPKSTA